MSNDKWLEAWKAIGVYGVGKALGEQHQNRLMNHVGAFRRELEKVAKLDKNLMPKARMERAAAILRGARGKLLESVAGEVQPLRAALAASQSKVRKAATPKGNADAAAAWELRVARYHSMFRELAVRQTAKGYTGPRVSQVLVTLAEAGDGAALAAVGESLVPLVDSYNLTRARDAFAEAMAPEDVTRSREIAEAVDEAERIEAQLDRAVGRIALEAGVDEPAIKAAQVPVPLEMSDAEKAAYITEHGLDEFQALVKKGQAPGADDDSDDKDSDDKDSDDKDSDDKDSGDDDKSTDGAVFVPSGNAA